MLPTIAIDTGRTTRLHQYAVIVVAVILLMTVFVTPVSASTTGMSLVTSGADRPVSTLTSTDTPETTTSSTVRNPDVPGTGVPSILTPNTRSYATCSGKGFVQGGICNVIENAKRSILKGALDAAQHIARSTLELILRRPVPKRGGEIVVFRPPTNQPLAGAYHGWTSVGLPLGFLVWVVGVGVALASRFRPETTFATQGFQIEQNIVRNLLLTIGSWWVGAFVLHLANGLILAVAPRGDQLVMGPKSGIGTLLGTGLLAGLLWVATAAIVTILLITTLLAYVLCLTFMVFLPVFSALMLFDIGGVLGTIGKFGQTGWDIFIRAAFFPLPAALVLGAGAYIASGTMGFVQNAVAVSGFSAVAGTLAFAAVTFVTQLAALVATLWMLLGSRATRTAGGIMAGVGGAAMYSRAKAGAKTLSNRASMAGVGSQSGAVSSTTGTTTRTGTGSPTGLIDGTPTTRPNATVNSATAPSGVLDTERRDGSSGAVAPIGTPTGGRPATPDSSTPPTSGTSAGTTADVESDEPIVVERRSDLPAEQRYQPGYLSGGEFQPIESRGQKRSLIVRGHDRFAAAYDSDGDHPGVYYRGEGNGVLYDAAPVAGEDWESNTAEQTEISRDAVFDARDGRGDSR